MQLSSGFKWHYSFFRLPSLRPIRDLALGGGTTSVSPASTPPSVSNVTAPSSQPSTRPKFTPNLAAAGRRQTPTVTPTPTPPESESNRGHGRGGRHNNQRGARGGRGRGRGRGGHNKFEPEIIQSKGIFSEGLAEADVKNRSADSDGYFSRGGGRDRPSESKERHSAKGAVKAEAIETDEEALKNLFRDDVSHILFFLFLQLMRLFFSL